MTWHTVPEVKRWLLLIGLMTGALGAHSRAGAAQATLAGSASHLTSARVENPQAAPQPPARLRIVRTGFYELHTDVSEIEAREAAVRMDAIAVEFLRQTNDLKRSPPPPFMQFKLFRRIEDYEAAGGTPGSGGQFDQRTGELMAVAGQQLNARTWHRVQHEAFHQFAHHTLGTELPPWLSEGLAEYFAESAFTGDALVNALIPEKRRQRVVAAMDGEFVAIERMMFMTADQWNEDLARRNYDQAWSLVLYLLHGDNGRHAAQFNQFLLLCSQGRGWQQAWKETFGTIEGLERGWVKWWRQLPENPTQQGYREATARTLTSFWARAAAQGQAIRDFDDFVRLGEAGQLAFDDRQWLPPSLLKQALDDAALCVEDGGAWTIRRIVPRTIQREGRPGISAIARGGDEEELVLLMPDGTAYRGRFAVDQRRVSAVQVFVERLPEDLLGEFEKLLDR